MAVWYIQKHKDRDGTTQRMIYAAQEMGYEVHVSDYRPFDNEIDLSFLPTDKPVIMHGAISCALSVRDRKLPLYPFAWFDPDKLKCSHYYAHWHQFLAQRVYGFYPLGVLKDKEDWLYEVYGRAKYWEINDEREKQIFIRPDTNDKLFVGEVVAKGRFDSYMNWIWIAENMGESMAVISRPETLLAEWRLLIAYGKVVEGSRYMDRGVFDKEPGFPDEAAVFAEEVCKTWTPHPMFVLDVASTPDGYRVVECGSINCAGYYECDMRKVVKAMSDVADQEFQKRAC